ncbi:unnamed protein product, partial [marine sediment metagenome]
QAPDWTESEFEVLVNSYGLPDEELAHRLPQRSMGAIEVVKEGIHAFHLGNDISMLSQMMRSYLDRRHGSVVCPKCGMNF